MRIKSASAFVMSPIAVIGVVALSIAITGGPAEVGGNGSQNHPSRATGTPHQSTDHRGATAANLVSVQPAAVSDQACDPIATPTLAAETDGRVRDAMESNPASNADPMAPAMSRSDAVTAARQMSVTAQEGLSGDTSEPSTELLPAAAAQEPFSQANRWFAGEDGDNSLVAPARCVWVVTVQAPFRPRSAPAGATATVFDSYTAVFDSRSGQYLGVTAGAESPNLLTGANTGNASR